MTSNLTNEAVDAIVALVNQTPRFMRELVGSHDTEERVNAAHFIIAELLRTAIKVCDYAGQDEWAKGDVDLETVKERFDDDLSTYLAEFEERINDNPSAGCGMRSMAW